MIAILKRSDHGDIMKLNNVEVHTLNFQETRSKGILNNILLFTISFEEKKRLNKYDKESRLVTND